MRRRSIQIVGLGLLSLVWLQPPASKAQDKAVPALGTEENPILCDRPSGEGWYLSRLRLPDGSDLIWQRLGSGGGIRHGEHTHILDIYQSDRGHRIWMDMYHPQYIEIQPPPGFRLLFQFSDHYEYVDGKLHKWDEKKPFTGTIDETFEYDRVDGYRLKVEVENGYIQGSLKRFHPSGQLWHEAAYGSANRRTGTMRYLREDGSLIVRYTFEEGILHGPFEYSPDDGSPEMKGRYEKGTMIEDEA